MTPNPKLNNEDIRQKVINDANNIYNRIQPVDYISNIKETGLDTFEEIEKKLDNFAESKGIYIDHLDGNIQRKDEQIAQTKIDEGAKEFVTDIQDKIDQINAEGNWFRAAKTRTQKLNQIIDNGRFDEIVETIAEAQENQRKQIDAQLQTLEGQVDQNTNHRSQNGIPRAPRDQNQTPETQTVQYSPRINQSPSTTDQEPPINQSPNTELQRPANLSPEQKEHIQSFIQADGTFTKTVNPSSLEQILPASIQRAYIFVKPDCVYSKVQDLEKNTNYPIVLNNGEYYYANSDRNIQEPPQKVKIREKMGINFLTPRPEPQAQAQTVQYRETANNGQTRRDQLVQAHGGVSNVPMILSPDFIQQLKKTPIGQPISNEDGTVDETSEDFFNSLQNRATKIDQSRKSPAQQQNMRWLNPFDPENRKYRETQNHSPLLNNEFYYQEPDIAHRTPGGGLLKLQSGRLSRGFESGVAEDLTRAEINNYNTRGLLPTFFNADAFDNGLIQGNAYCMHAVKNMIRHSYNQGDISHEARNNFFNTDFNARDMYTIQERNGVKGERTNPILENIGYKGIYGLEGKFFNGKNTPGHENGPRGLKPGLDNQKYYLSTASKLLARIDTVPVGSLIGFQFYRSSNKEHKTTHAAVKIKDNFTKTIDPEHAPTYDLTPLDFVVRFIQDRAPYSISKDNIIPLLTNTNISSLVKVSYTPPEQIGQEGATAQNIDLMSSQKIPAGSEVKLGGSVLAHSFQGKTSTHFTWELFSRGQRQTNRSLCLPQFMPTRLLSFEQPEEMLSNQGRVRQQSFRTAAYEQIPRTEGFIIPRAKEGEDQLTFRQVWLQRIFETAKQHREELHPDKPRQILSLEDFFQLQQEAKEFCTDTSNPLKITKTNHPTCLERQETGLRSQYEAIIHEKILQQQYIAICGRDESAPIGVEIPYADTRGQNAIIIKNSYDQYQNQQNEEIELMNSQILQDVADISENPSLLRTKGNVFFKVREGDYLELDENDKPYKNSRNRLQQRVIGYFLNFLGVCENCPGTLDYLPYLEKMDRLTEERFRTILIHKCDRNKNINVYDFRNNLESGEFTTDKKFAINIQDVNECVRMALEQTQGLRQANLNIPEQLTENDFWIINTSLRDANPRYRGVVSNILVQEGYKHGSGRRKLAKDIAEELPTRMTGIESFTNYQFRFYPRPWTRSQLIFAIDDTIQNIDSHPRENAQSSYNPATGTMMSNDTHTNRQNERHIAVLKEIRTILTQTGTIETENGTVVQNENISETDYEKVVNKIHKITDLTYDDDYFLVGRYFTTHLAYQLVLNAEKQLKTVLGPQAAQVYKLTEDQQKVYDMLTMQIYTDGTYSKTNYALRTNYLYRVLATSGINTSTLYQPSIYETQENKVGYTGNVEHTTTKTIRLVYDYDLYITHMEKLKSDLEKRSFSNPKQQQATQLVINYINNAIAKNGELRYDGNTPLTGYLAENNQNTLYIPTLEELNTIPLLREVFQYGREIGQRSNQSDRTEQRSQTEEVAPLQSQNPQEQIKHFFDIVSPYINPETGAFDEILGEEGFKLGGDIITQEDIDNNHRLRTLYISYPADTPENNLRQRLLQQYGIRQHPVRIVRDDNLQNYVYQENLSKSAIIIPGCKPYIEKPSSENQETIFAGRLEQENLRSFNHILMTEYQEGYIEDGVMTNKVNPLSLSQILDPTKIQNDPNRQTRYVSYDVHAIANQGSMASQLIKLEEQNEQKGERYPHIHKIIRNPRLMTFTFEDGKKAFVRENTHISSSSQPKHHHTLKEIPYYHATEERVGKPSRTYTIDDYLSAQTQETILGQQKNNFSEYFDTQYIDPQTGRIKNTINKHTKLHAISHLIKNNKSKINGNPSMHSLLVDYKDQRGIRKAIRNGNTYVDYYTKSKIQILGGMQLYQTVPNGYVDYDAVRSVGQMIFTDENERSITYCAMTKRLNAEKAGVILPEGDAKTSINTVERGIRRNGRQVATRKRSDHEGYLGAYPPIEQNGLSYRRGMENRNNFLQNIPENCDFIELGCNSTSELGKIHGHALILRKDTNGNWYAIDSYVNVAGYDVDSPIPLGEFLDSNAVKYGKSFYRCHFYETGNLIMHTRDRGASYRQRNGLETEHTSETADPIAILRRAEFSPDKIEYGKNIVKITYSEALGLAKLRPLASQSEILANTIFVLDGATQPSYNLAILNTPNSNLSTEEIKTKELLIDIYGPNGPQPSGIAMQGSGGSDEGLIQDLLNRGDASIGVLTNGSIIQAYPPGHGTAATSSASMINGNALVIATDIAVEFSADILYHYKGSDQEFINYRKQQGVFSSEPYYITLTQFNQRSANDRSRTRNGQQERNPHTLQIIDTKDPSDNPAQRRAKESVVQYLTQMHPNIQRSNIHLSIDYTSFIDQNGNRTFDNHLIAPHVDGRNRNRTTRNTPEISRLGPRNTAQQELEMLRSIQARIRLARDMNRRLNQNHQMGNTETYRRNFLFDYISPTGDYSIKFDENRSFIQKILDNSLTIGEYKLRKRENGPIAST